jgi:hypothetical protein
MAVGPNVHLFSSTQLLLLLLLLLALCCASVRFQPGGRMDFWPAWSQLPYTPPLCICALASTC